MEQVILLKFKFHQPYKRQAMGLKFYKKIVFLI